MITELRNRGVRDIFIACVDGLKGFPEAIEAVFPQAQVQLCIVHLARQSLNYVGYKQRKEVATDLQSIYRAATREEAGLRLEEFAAKWDSRYPMISQSWRRNWEHVTPFFAYPEDIRKVIYTTNAVVLSSSFLPAFSATSTILKSGCFTRVFELRPVRSHASS